MTKGAPINKAEPVLLPAGEYRVTLRDGTPAELTIDLHPTCSLIYLSDGENKRLQDYFCDGVDSIQEPAPANPSVWINRGIRPSTDSMENKRHLSYVQNFVGADAEILRALQQVVKGYSFASAALFTQTERKKAEIRFDNEGDTNLTPDDMERLNDVIESYKYGDITVEGYCSQTGTPENNLVLGGKRAQAVAAYLKKELAKKGYNPDIYTVSFGESKSVGQSLAENRRAVVILGATFIQRALEVFEGDFLIDASGSMMPFTHDVRAYNFPKSANLFSFESCRGVKKFAEARLYKPKENCGTPLWKSAFEKVSEMKSGTLVVLTDGKNTDASITLQQLIDKANENGVSVSTIYVGLSDIKTETDLMRLSKETGGSSYMRTTTN